MKQIKIFDDFLEKLSNEDEIPNVTNQYSVNILRNNLRLYLNYLYKLSPKYIFIGEAPGYNGCKITGIPFTSEYILNIDFGNGIFGIKNGYKTINANNCQKEPTATIVWELFNKYQKTVPCFWNIFPFHPHIANNKLSNRKPNQSELKIGIKYLEELIRLLNINKKNIIPIGNVAYDIIKKYNKHCIKIRHPANGGKNKYIANLIDSGLMIE